MAAKEKACYEKVKEMLFHTNAPQSVQSAINNTGSEFTKTYVEKALARLVDEGKATFVEVGKSGKLYVWNQKLLKVLEPEELKQVQEETKKLEKELAERESDVATLHEAVQQLEAKLTEEQMVEKLTKLKAKHARLEEELKASEGVPVITEEQLNKAKAKLKKDYKIWADRRATVAEMVGNLSEATETKKSDLMEQIGVDQGADRAEMREFLQLIK